MHAQTYAQAQQQTSALALAETARNLQFLALIDSTIDAVSSDTEHVRVCTQTIDKYMTELQQGSEGVPISREEQFVEVLDKTMEIARSIHTDSKRRHQAACEDRMLRPDDGVTDVYEGLIEASAELFSCAAEFKDWIETHNALLEPSSGEVYSSAEALLAALHAD